MKEWYINKWSLNIYSNKIQMRYIPLYHWNGFKYPNMLVSEWWYECVESQDRVCQSRDEQSCETSAFPPLSNGNVKCSALRFKLWIVSPAAAHSCVIAPWYTSCQKHSFALCFSACEIVIRKMMLYNFDVERGMRLVGILSHTWNTRLSDLNSSRFLTDAAEANNLPHTCTLSP